MNDPTRWELRGPVRTLQTRLAEWNPETKDWEPLKIRLVATFRPDGLLSEIEHHNLDGSVPREVRIYDDGRLAEYQWWANGELTRKILHTYDVSGRPVTSVMIDAQGIERVAERYRYDDNGRKTKVVFLTVPEDGAPSCSTSSCGMLYGVEGSDAAYSAPGATTSTTTYDERDLPLEVSFHDVNNSSICRVVFARDQDGRPQSERMQFERQATFFGLANDSGVAIEERESLAQLLPTIFEDQTLSLTTYAYDHEGRRTERIRRMGHLSEARTIFRYDDHDNPVEEVTEERSRDMRIENGAAKIDERPFRVQYVRFEYQYDTHGNWIERIVWQRGELNREEQRSNIERRTITYYAL